MVRDIPNVAKAEMAHVVMLTLDTEYMQGVASQTPVFSTAYSPAHSNAAYVLISVAVERMTGTPFEGLFNEKLVIALGLNATSYAAPPPVDKRALVPGSAGHRSGMPILDRSLRKSTHSCLHVWY